MTVLGRGWGARGVHGGPTPLFMAAQREGEKRRKPLSIKTSPSRTRTYDLAVNSRWRIAVSRETVAISSDLRRMMAAQLWRPSLSVLDSAVFSPAERRSAAECGSG